MRFRILRLLALVALALAGALAVTDGASAARLTWSTSTAYQSSMSATGTIFTSLSCSSVGNCLAVGVTPNGSNGWMPVMAVASNGTWGTTVNVVLPSGHSTSGDSSDLSSVSCISASSCEAVGTYETAGGDAEGMVVPIEVSGASAAQGTAIELPLPTGATQAELEGVSCTSTACTAVGESDAGPLVATNAAGSWASAIASVPAASTAAVELLAVSCPATGPCEAVGVYNEGFSTYDWAIQVSAGVPGSPEDVNLPSDFVPTNLVLDQGEGSMIPYVNLYGLDSVSCPSAGACTAAGTYTTANSTVAITVPIGGGTPAGVVEVGGSAANGAMLDSIWCSDASDCVVGGVSEAAGPVYSAGTAIESGGDWSGLASLPGAPSESDAAQAVTSLTCADAGACEAAGFASTSAPSTRTFFDDSVPQLAVTTTTLPPATVGVPYSATLQGAGAYNAYNWALASGSLPAGLSMNGATGVISGTPMTAGQTGFVLSLNSPGATGTSASLSITVNAAAQPPSPSSTPSPTSTPSTPSTPSVSKVTISFVSISGTKASVVLGCSGAACAGTLKATVIEKLKTSAKTDGHKTAKPKTKTITALSGHYSLAAGKDQVVKLTLARAAIALFSKEHKFTTVLDVTPSGAKTAAVTKKLTFTAPKKKK